MLKTLSIQRLYLSELDDWVWVRWYWCREGAQPLRYWTCYGSQVWEDHRTPEPPHPLMPLAPAVRVGPSVSPYPGRFPHGQLIWYETGLPLEERVPFPGSNQCGVQNLYSEGTVGIEGSSAEVVEYVGSSIIQYLVPVIQQTIGIPAGEPGDLLVAVVRCAGEGRPVPWPAGWTSFAEGRNPVEANISWGVAWQYAESGQGETREWSPDPAPHCTGFVARYRNAGPPFAASFHDGQTPIGSFDPVQLPTGFLPSVLWALCRFVNLDAGLAIPDTYKVHERVGNSSESQAWGRDLLQGTDSPYVNTATGDGFGYTAIAVSIPLAGESRPLRIQRGGRGDMDASGTVFLGSGLLEASGGDGDDGAAFILGSGLLTASGGDGDGGGAEEWDTMYPGEMRLFGGTTIPSGWLNCNGQAVSRTTYANLFAAISTNYGVGDGSTTFNVPDFKGRVVVGQGAGAGLSTRGFGQTGGEEAHQLIESEIPSHQHTVDGGVNFVTDDVTGAAYSEVSGTAGAAATATSFWGGDGLHENMPPWGCARYLIKT